MRSISSEQGQRFVLTARVAHPALGSDFNFRQLTASYARYFALPWTWSATPLHHVFAARLAGGVARGDQNERHLFSLGGFDSGDPVSTILNPVNAPVRILRDDATRETPGIEGFYPVGEGAGYAGGIVSAAIDGLKTAKAILAKYAPLETPTPHS